ncbi:hypothetical protein ACFL3D_04425 [Candidatus Omnitrophota bacterium]
MKKAIICLLIAVVCFSLFTAPIAFACDSCGCQAEEAAQSISAEKVWWNPLTWFKSNKTSCELKE